ncbi:MAG: MCE family protein [Bacteroidetes bacterium]|nr:MCE family protein [Bacteroidota bacterium]
MRSTKNRRAVVVGIVLVLGLLIFAVGILTLGGQKHSFSSSFTLQAIFKDVNGLQKGNNIWYSGVKVGTIRSVGFSPAAEVVVTMSVDETVQRFIHRDALAKVGTDGLIGNRIIVLFGGSPTAPLVADGDTLMVESASGLDGMMDTLKQNNRNLLAITTSFRKLSDDLVMGKGTVGKLLTQDDLANTLQDALTALQHAAKSAESLTAHLDRFSQRLSTPGSFSNDLVSDTLVFHKLRESATDVKAAAANIQAATEKLNDPNSPLGLLLRDSAAAANLRSTLHNLNSGTDKFDEDMEAMQHNFLLRGFFKKKKQQGATLPASK